MKSGGYLVGYDYDDPHDWRYFATEAEAMESARSLRNPYSDVKVFKVTEVAVFTHHAKR